MDALLASFIILAGINACATAHPTQAAPATSPAAPSAPAPAAAGPAGPVPPIAAQKPFAVRAPHGAVRSDEYYWLRDDTRQNPEMLAYLASENAYTDAVMAPLSALKDTLYREIVGRIQQDDSSVPYLKRGYWYYTRFEAGKDYPIVARRKRTMGAPEEILLDENQLAAGKPYFHVGGWEVSPDNQWLAFLEDSVGRRQYTLRIKHLTNGEVLPDTVTGLSDDVVWADDNLTIWYVENDPVTLLTKRVKAHRIGGTAPDTVVYEEADDTYYVGVSRTRSEQYLCIGMYATLSSEQRCTETARPGELKLVAPRQRDFEYHADHLKGRWVITTNWDAPNFRIMTVPDGRLGDRARWKELVPHHDDVFIEDVELFDTFLAIDERSEGLRRIRVLDARGTSKFVASDEPAYTMALDVNAEPHTKWLRYTYASLTTPTTTYEVHADSDARKLLKREPVLGGYDPTLYVTERLWAPARDGARVPISVVYRKGFEKNGQGPLLQYGYGSYGHAMDPRFSVSLVSLLDRGLVYAIAHVRGGQELGRKWYDAGRLQNKRNTFTDFIDVTTFLVAQGYAAPNRVAASGASAGGLLMGAISNMAPEKYRVVLAQVPFVDVVTTMLDASIPLTTNEYDEWGNPEEREAYDIMLSYSPYDQLERKAYPAMFVGTGLWDSQVQYYEPAKYVARLRAKKTDDRKLVLRTNMDAGHGGKSGRFRRYAEAAEYYAFMLDQLGMSSATLPP